MTHWWYPVSTSLSHCSDCCCQSNQGRNNLDTKKKKQQFHKLFPCQIQLNEPSYSYRAISVVQLVRHCSKIAKNVGLNPTSLIFLLFFFTRKGLPAILPIFKQYFLLKQLYEIQRRSKKKMQKVP